MTNPDLLRRIDELRDRLIEWSEKPTSWIFPQFLYEERLGWSEFLFLMRMHTKLHNDFEATIARLCSRWMGYGMDNQKLPKHMRDAFAKYIDVYDGHLQWMKHDLAETLSTGEAPGSSYISPDYRAATLGRFEKFWKEDRK